MRAGDSLLLTATGSGTMLQIDGDGDGIYEHSGAPGDRFAHAYNTTGTFIASAKIDGILVGSLTVKVIAVGLGGPTACQVGFQRTKEVAVEPPAEVGNVLFVADEFTPMDVSLRQTTSTGETLNLTTFARGTPVLLARIGGADGPIATYKEVDEFTVDVAAEQSVNVDPDTGVGRTAVDIHPYVSDLEFDFHMFASLSRFTGGITSFNVNTSVDFTRYTDPVTNEEVGRFFYEIEVPLGETKYCFNVNYFQQEGQGKAFLGKPGDSGGIGFRYEPVPQQEPNKRPVAKDPGNNGDPEVCVYMFLFGWQGAEGKTAQTMVIKEMLGKQSVFKRLEQLGWHPSDAHRPLIEAKCPEITPAFQAQNQLDVKAAFDDKTNKKKIIVDIYTTKDDLKGYLARTDVNGIYWVSHGLVEEHPPGSKQFESFVKTLKQPVGPMTYGDPDPFFAGDWLNEISKHSPYDFIVIHACWSGAEERILDDNALRDRLKGAKLSSFKKLKDKCLQGNVLARDKAQGLGEEKERDIPIQWMLDAIDGKKATPPDDAKE